MVWRATLAFVALPGVVAFLVPWLLIDRRMPDRPFHVAGVIPLAIGGALLSWCVVTFYRQGRGTLAPWDPPRALVVTGAYRWSRNPMYVAVVLVLWGWAVALRERSLVTYAVIVTAAFHLRVVFGEEPWLARRYGEQWVQYKAAVPRWLGIPRWTNR
jgi:protein-S-isoprenylcysteine O-methyltransferase Ste14